MGWLDSAGTPADVGDALEEELAEASGQAGIEEEQQRKVQEKSDGSVGEAGQCDAVHSARRNEPDHRSEHGCASGEIDDGDGSDAVEGHQGVVRGDAEGEEGGAAHDERKDGARSCGKCGACQDAEDEVAEKEEGGGAGGDEEEVGEECASDHLPEFFWRGGQAACG